MITTESFQGRVRVRVLATDGSNRGGLLDTTTLMSGRQWPGEVRHGCRQILVEQPDIISDEDGERAPTGGHHWWLLEQALDRQLDVFNAEDAIDYASLARRRTPEQARAWFIERSLPLPESLVALPSTESATASTKGAQGADVLTDVQRRILHALNNVALSKKQLIKAVGLAAGTDIYRKQRGSGLIELKHRGLVKYKRGLGYYRPDRPPPNP